MQAALGAVKMTAEVVNLRELEGHQPVSWLIARFDNAAACYFARRHLSTRSIIAMCVEFHAELEEECGIIVMLEHIPGKVNTIPDYLSRESIREAVELMKAQRDIELICSTRIDACRA